MSTVSTSAKEPASAVRGTREPRPAQLLRIRPRTGLALVGCGVLTLLAVAWPLVVAPESAIAQGAQATVAPWIFAVLLPLTVVVVLAEMAEGGIDAKALAILGVLAAVGAAVRALGAGTAGIETVFFLIVLAARVFGPGFGFALGALTLLTSALLTGGVGPWLPYQMLGAAWFGFGAGMLPQLRAQDAHDPDTLRRFPRRQRWGEITMLAVYAAGASLAYGVMMNLSFWPFAIGPGTEISFVPGAPVGENLGRLVAFSFATSLGWDIGRAATTAVLVVLTGGPILRALRRTARRAVFSAG